mmetsp:Transcript_47639/g.153192  ORF Transcript_47639/g.153192 Transcript_47639/m.153192 type:complete len:400 (+) Transcript_47639:1088-2287(+)
MVLTGDDIGPANGLHELAVLVAVHDEHRRPLRGLLREPVAVGDARDRLGQPLRRQVGVRREFPHARQATPREARAPREEDLQPPRAQSPVRGLHHWVRGGATLGEVREPLEERRVAGHVFLLEVEGQDFEAVHPHRQVAVLWQDLALDVLHEECQEPQKLQPLALARRLLLRPSHGAEAHQGFGDGGHDRRHGVEVVDAREILQRVVELLQIPHRGIRHARQQKGGERTGQQRRLHGSAREERHELPGLGPNNRQRPFLRQRRQQSRCLAQLREEVRRRIVLGGHAEQRVDDTPGQIAARRRSRRGDGRAQDRAAEVREDVPAASLGGPQLEEADEVLHGELAQGRLGAAAPEAQKNRWALQQPRDLEDQDQVGGGASKHVAQQCSRLVPALKKLLARP